MKNAIFIFISFLAGILVTGACIVYQASFPESPVISPLGKIIAPKQVIGFLPYWLLDKAQSDYSSSITTLTYFALRIDKDGTILQQTTPTQKEPGWYALESGKATPFLQKAKENNCMLSLAIDSGDVNAINGVISQPAGNAQHLVSTVLPLMQQYSFSDLNLDIEYTAPASPAARTAFTAFVKSVRQNLPDNMTLTLEISTLDVVQPHLIDVKAVSPFADHIVLMAYDFHTPDSFVTGPIAPLAGAGISSEYDVTAAIAKTLEVVPEQKIILGIPLYGYEWETLMATPRSAVIPGSGVLASANRVQSLLASCASCSTHIDQDAQESYTTYFNNDTNSTHMIFFPTEASTQAKIAFAKKANLGGLALWALGYEDDSILMPLPGYIKE